MPTIYSDAEREERYGRLRTKRIRLEKYRDILMWIILFTLGIGSVVSIVSGVIYGIFMSVTALFSTLFDLAEAAAVIYAVYKRDYRVTACVLLGYVVTTFISIGAFGGTVNYGDFVVLVLLIELVIDVQWHKLSQEEGFPLFDITYAEREERKRTQEELVRNRALSAGVRVAATEQTADMGDLLDAGFDAPVLAPHLNARHERSGIYAEPGTQIPDAFVNGKMDMLEEIGAPPKSDEMDEL